MIRAAAMLAVLLASTAALAQQSFHPKTVVVDPEEGLPLYKRKFFPPEGYVSPENQLLSTLAALTQVAALPPQAAL